MACYVGPGKPGGFITPFLPHVLLITHVHQRPDIEEEGDRPVVHEVRRISAYMLARLHRLGPIKSFFYSTIIRRGADTRNADYTPLLKEFYTLTEPVISAPHLVDADCRPDFVLCLTFC